MALQKSLTARGVTGNYWQIANKNYVKDTGKTSALLRCYVSAEVRDTGLENNIAIPEFQKIVEFDGDLTTAEVYTAAKASLLVQDVETSFFVNATDA
jgi:hypothetical protein